jgi:F0F1-type ATP synthase delta subunit
VLPGNPNIEEFLRSGAISRDRKPPVLEAAFRGRASDLFVNFLLVLNKHDRLGLLRAVLVAYQDLLDQRSRRARVHVRSATPLHDDQKESLLHLLREVMQRVRCCTPRSIRHCSAASWCASMTSSSTARCVRNCCVCRNN